MIPAADACDIASALALVDVARARAAAGDADGAAALLGDVRRLLWTTLERPIGRVTRRGGVELRVIDGGRVDGPLGGWSETEEWLRRARATRGEGIYKWPSSKK